ncbi:MAG: hypothetical protein LBR61_08245 [Synergistaceae bacterium]|nr:hypothetical protein [Synergistaceae bacterium]
MEILKFFGVSADNNVATGWLVVVAIVYAIGDYASAKTKAIFSMIFVSGIIFLVAFWFGLPQDIFQRTSLIQFTVVVAPILLVHMGTLMKVKTLIHEWKTVTIAFLGLVGLSIGLYYVASPVIGNVQALTAAGPISGGIVATMIIQQVLEAENLPHLVVFASVLLVIQNFVGLPVASFCLKHEGRRLVKNYREGKVSSADSAGEADPDVPAYRLFPATPKLLQTNFILLAKNCVVGYLAVWLSERFALMAGIHIDRLILSLILGIAFYELGFLEHDILTKANSAGLGMFFCLVPIWTGLSRATPAMVRELIFPTVLCFGIAIVCLAITSLILGLILRYSWFISMAISVTCLFGFPATFFIAQEVSSALSETDEEQKYMMSQLLPKMMIGGFTTVTIGSTVLAGYLAEVIKTLH